MNAPQLIHRLQLLQRRLCEMADDLGTLTDPEIIAVSEEADRLIVQLQRLRREEAEVRKKAGLPPSGAVLPCSQAPEEIGEQDRAVFVKNS